MSTTHVGYGTRPRVYLGGPIHGLTYAQATVWRQMIVKMAGLKFEFLNPMRDKEDLKKSPTISHVFPDLPLCQPKAIVTRDLLDIRRADVLLFNGLQGTVGSAIELGIGYALNKPLVVILEQSDALRAHPFIKDLPGLLVVESLEEAVQVLVSLFNVQEDSWQTLKSCVERTNLTTSALASGGKSV